MKRGDLVPISMSGDYGKPRPALVMQADQFGGTGSVSILLLSAMLVDAPLIRITVQPTPGNGLRKPSQVMIDKAMTSRRDKVGAPFGRLDAETMLVVSRSLPVFLGIV